MAETRKFFTLITLSLVCAWSSFPREWTAAQLQEARKNIVSAAKQYIGCDYQSGATGPEKFDCSGLIYTVMRDAAGVQMPRSVQAIYSKSTPIKTSQAEPGDLVFFKTTGNGTISHIGIYIGKNQFIHAASDGSNTGVIVSSLKEKYYANCFATASRILPSLSETEAAEASAAASGEKKTETEPPAQTGQKESETKSAEEKVIAIQKSKNQKWYSNFIFDSALFCDWAFYLPERLKFNWRGIALETNVRYGGWQVQPGLGTILRYNYGTSHFQIPIVLSATFNECFKFYIGPVINFPGAVLPDGAKKEIKGPFFPGIIGFSIQTPPFTIGKIQLSLTQDISYTYYKEKNGVQLSAKENAATGIVFSTGIRVTLPLYNIFN